MWVVVAVLILFVLIIMCLLFRSKRQQPLPPPVEYGPPPPLEIVVNDFTPEDMHRMVLAELVLRAHGGIKVIRSDSRGELEFERGTLERESSEILKSGEFNCLITQRHGP